MVAPKRNQNTQANEQKDSTQETVVVDLEKEQLKSELEQLKVMMAQILEQQKTQEDNPVSGINKSLYESAEQRYDIDPKTYFSLVSMVNGGLHLRGLHTIYSIPEFGNSISVAFEDLRAIVNNHPVPTREGMYLIKSEKAVKALSLDQYYDKFVSQDTIQKIMLLNNSEIKSIFETTTETIKQTIVEKIVEGVANGDNIYQDRNKVKFIGDLVGKNLTDFVREIEDLRQ